MRYIIPVIIIAALLFYFFLPASKDKDASSQIETVLNNLVQSGKRKDSKVIMEYFSPDYSDSSGRDYAAAKSIIQSTLDRFDTVDGGYSNLIVSTVEDIDGKTRNVANLDIWISGEKTGKTYKLVGTKDNPKNIDIVFETLFLGGWKILSLEKIN